MYKYVGHISSLAQSFKILYRRYNIFYHRMLAPAIFSHVK